MDMLPETYTLSPELSQLTEISIYSHCIKKRKKIREKGLKYPPVGDIIKISKGGEEVDPHIHAHQKQVLNRLARIEGHVRAVKQMVSDGRDCSEVLLQIAAVRKALDNTAKVILKDHLEHCLIHAIEDHNEDFMKDLQKALDHYIR